MGTCTSLSESQTQTGHHTDWYDGRQGTAKEQSYPAIELPVQFFIRCDLVSTKHKQFLKDEWDGYGESEWPAQDSTNCEINDCGKRPLTILIAGRYESMRQRKHCGIHRER
jgi:hypothetical protein